jgi:hypothetical protein
MNTLLDISKPESRTSSESAESFPLFERTVVGPFKVLFGIDESSKERRLFAVSLDFDRSPIFQNEVTKLVQVGPFYVKYMFHDGVAMCDFMMNKFLSGLRGTFHPSDEAAAAEVYMAAWEMDLPNARESGTKLFAYALSNKKIRKWLSLGVLIKLAPFLAKEDRLWSEVTKIVGDVSFGEPSEIVAEKCFPRLLHSRIKPYAPYKL